MHLKGTNWDNGEYERHRVDIGRDRAGRWVRQWRHDHRWTQERLAEALGYDVSYVAKIEQGRRRPSGQFLARLAVVLGVDDQELLQAARRPTARLRLPVPRTEIVGREREIDEVSQLLRESRCASLVGAPGIGKTALALEVAWRIADDFRHGACFVGLTDVSEPTSVTSAVLQAMGLLERGSADLDDFLCQAVHDQDLLLILDTFEHVLVASPLVSRLVDEVPQVRILITSREALRVPSENVYAVGPLRFPESGQGAPDDLEDYPAVQLFVKRSGLVRDGFVLNEGNADSVMEICARLAGVPLAITLTARASRILTPSDIAKSLRARLELPTDGAAEPLTHERLETAMDWSWTLLSNGQRALLATLGVFSGGCSLAAVEAVCSGTGEDLLPALTALEAKSLLETTQFGEGDSRFVCLEPIRRYALDRLSERGLLDDVKARHCSYFVELAEAIEPEMTAGPNQSRALKQLEADHSNFAVAFEWALENAPESALRLSAALWRFSSMARISEGRRWLTSALAGAAGTPLLRSRALNGLGILARAQGDLRVAEASFTQAGALAARCGARKELAFATLTLGIVAEDQGLYDVAEARFIDAMAVYSEIGEERGVGHALNCLGVVALRRGDLRSAFDQFHDALGRFRRLNDRWSVAVTAMNLGWIAEMTGELGEACEWYQESYQIWQPDGDEHGRGRSLVSLGRVARRQRRFPEARRLLEDALQVFHRLGDRRLAAACLGELADVSYERKRFDMAARLLAAAETLRGNLGTPAWPEEMTLEAHVLGALREEMGAAALDRTFAMGRALTLEDVVEMVHSDVWPPVVRRGAARPS